MNTRNITRKIGLIGIVVVLQLAPPGAVSHAQAASFTPVSGGYQSTSMVLETALRMAPTFGLELTCATYPVQSGRPAAGCR